VLAGAPGTSVAQDADSDGDPDVTDPCPHVALATPSVAAGYKAILKYDSTGPGGGDDSLFVRKFFFITLTPIDPTSGDNVHITLRNTMTGATLFSADLLPGAWTQPYPPKLRWDYTDKPGTANGVRKALLKEAVLVALPGGHLYKFKVPRAINTNIASSLGVGDGVEAILEIEQANAGVCFSASADTCTNKPERDTCLP
jgi:hypothetical protein